MKSSVPPSFTGNSGSWAAVEDTKAPDEESNAGICPGMKKRLARFRSGISRSELML